MTIDLAVVTGAGRGIGRAVAQSLGKTGVHVLCIAGTENAQNVASEIGANAEGLCVDLRDPDATRSAVAAWLGGKAFRRIGVALAGGVLGPRGPVDTADVSLAAFTDVYAINVTGNLAVLAGLLPRMREHRFGRIVGFAGGGAAYAYPMFPAYAASKAAMVRTIENLAEDLKSAGDFAAVALAPGAVETDMLAEVRKAGAEIRTTVDISEPARFCTEFLSSEACAFSGSFVHVRDEWPKLLAKDAKLEPPTKWKLRRTE